MLGFKRIGEPQKLPIIEGYHNLNEAQKDLVAEQGYWEEDHFPIAKWEIFFEFGEYLFSETIDFNTVGSFNVLQGHFSYFFTAYGEDFGCNFYYTDGVRTHVIIQQVQEI